MYLKKKLFDRASKVGNSRTDWLHTSHSIYLQINKYTYIFKFLIQYCNVLIFKSIKFTKKALGTANRLFY